MAKNKVSEYSATAANNTDIGGINIAEGCAPSGINNAIRELMAQLKDMQTGSDSDGFVVAGTMTCSGAAVMSSTLAVSGTATFTGNISVQGNATIGNASTDAHTLDGVLTGATGAKVLLDDSVTTATAPALAFDGDTNTGIYRPAADTISIGTGGAERVRVADAGVIVNQALTCSGAVVMSSTVALGSSATATTPTFGDNTTKVATTAFVQAALAAAYPVGSIYINATNSTNPGTLLGFGTWTAFGAGRVMVGLDGSNAAFDTAEETGGSANAIVVSHTHTATTDSAGTHSHTFTIADMSSLVSGTYAGTAPGATRNQTTATAGAHTHTFTTDSTGSSGTNANLQPYIVVYMWKRTA